MVKQDADPVSKSSVPWRLKPLRQDPLEIMGFVSKGDSRLLEHKAQDVYYRNIVTRFMQFCARHGKDLDAAFTSLAEHHKIPNQISAAAESASRPSAASTASLSTDTKSATERQAQKTELTMILTALRKLREGILGSSTRTASPLFAQRVHVFNIKVGILASDPASYHPSLTYLLNVLHTTEHPLPRSELVEMTTYAILDRALRQNDLIAAYELEYTSKKNFGYANRHVDALLRAVVADNWVAFWRIRRRVDGYLRALIHCHLASLRRTTLKAFGRAYFKSDINWLLQSATGSEMTWEELVETEQVGWQRDGNNITIRKPRAH